MSIEEIRKHRGIPAKRGMKVFSRHSKRFGVITGTSGGCLKIRLDGDKHSRCFHPTWELEFILNDGSLWRAQATK